MKEVWPIKYPIGTKVVIKRIVEMCADGRNREIDTWVKKSIGETVEVISEPFFSSGRIEIELKEKSHKYYNYRAWLPVESFEEINTEARTNLIKRIKERSGKQWSIEMETK